MPRARWVQGCEMRELPALATPQDGAATAGTSVVLLRPCPNGFASAQPVPVGTAHRLALPPYTMPV